LTTFILVCAGLVLVSGAFYLFPRARGGGADEDLESANLEWFRLRRQEIAELGDEALEADARLRLLEDEQASPAPAPAAGRSHGFPAWVLLPVVAIASGALYYELGAAPDVLITRQLESLDDSSTEAEMQGLMQAIERRAGQRPENMGYTALLGRYYMGREEYARAAEFYGGLAQQAPEDAQALALAAQAQYLAAGRSLNDSVRMRAEQALSIDPHQRTALGLLGMASYEQGQYRAAVAYWQRLLATEPPGSEGARMIAGVIESARRKLGEDVGPAAAPATAAAAGAGVTVRVALPDQADASPSDTVFVLARNAGSESRMPIAVQRLQVAQLPVTLRLDDSNSMAGQKLSEAESVLVIVQVSPEGRPGEASATWLGQAGPLAPSLESEPLDILLQPRGG
jgi:cytochrome c-type biogenesis protein CcmH